jgi:hypothetical protein
MTSRIRLSASKGRIILSTSVEELRFSEFEARLFLAALEDIKEKKILASQKVKVCSGLEIKTFRDYVDLELSRKIYALNLAELPEFTRNLAGFIKLAFGETR